MRPRSAVPAAAALLALALIPPAPAHAGDKSAPAQFGPIPGVDPQRNVRWVTFEVGPVIGENGSYPAGSVELLVHVRNSASEPRKGEIVITPDEMWRSAVVTARASFSVPANGEAHVRIPVRATSGLSVRATAEGEDPWDLRLYSRTGNEIGVTFLAPTTPARQAVLGASVMATFDPPEARGSGSGALRPFAVHVPRVDRATGEPILPERTVGWAHEDLVVGRTDLVGRIGAAPMEALAGFVLGGGTLALTVARPEDLRAPRIVALLGGEASAIPAPAEARAPIEQGLSNDPQSPGAAPAEGTRLSGWAGGNLRPSPFGAVATYGLGEVVLLAFDPDDPQVVSDPFVRGRLLELGRRAFERRATVALDPASEPPYGGPIDDDVRRNLDPNENTRWTVGVAALLLLVYSIVAGPISFARATRKGKPLRALWHLPIWSLVTFLLIVGLGAFAKGLTGRARRITLVDAGAGMDVGVARRWRGFYAARATDVEVRATDRSSFLWMASVEGADLLAGAQLVAERDGARLTDVPALPWECVVVREDGFAGLGEGIGIVPDGPDGVTIVNGTGRALRAVLVKQPDDGFRYFPRLEPGAQARAADGHDLSSEPRKYGSFVTSVSIGRTAGRMTIHPFNAYQLEQSKLFDDESKELGGAWRAIEQATSHASIDWWPRGVPVVVAQIDGGEGRTSDSGFRLDSDRMLVRVVGWGR